MTITYDYAEMLYKAEKTYGINMLRRDGMHYYTSTHGDIAYPSVTSILAVLDKPQLVKWTQKMTHQRLTELCNGHQGTITAHDVIKWGEEAAHASDEYKDATADLGTRIHEHIERHIECNGMWDVQDDEYEHVAYAKRVLADYKPVAAEYMVWQAAAHDRCGTGGSIDAIMHKGDTLHLFDWKTGNTIYDTHKMQICTYAAILYNMIYVATGARVSIVCHVCNTKHRRHLTISDIAEQRMWYNRFLGVARAWDATHYNVDIFW